MVKESECKVSRGWKFKELEFSFTGTNDIKNIKDDRLQDNKILEGEQISIFETETKIKE